MLPRHFLIRTDKKSLKFLLEKSISTIAQQAWLAKLQPFDYEIQYKQDFENRAVDALSRLFRDNNGYYHIDFTRSVDGSYQEYMTDR